MAEKIPPVELAMTGNNDDLIEALDGSINRLFSMEGAILGVSAALGFMASKAVVDAVQAMAEFESAMAGVQKVTGVSDEMLDRIGGRLKEISAELGVSVEQLGEFAEGAARAGVRGEEALAKFAETVAKADIATNLEGDEMADQLARLIKFLGLANDEVETVVSTINELGNQLPTDAQRIMDAVSRMSSDFRALGLNAPQILGLAAAASTLRESSRNAARRARRLAQEMMSPSRLEKIADAFGTTSEQIKSLRDNAPVPTLLALSQIMSSNTMAAERLRDVFGTRTAGVLQNFGGNIEDVQKALRIANEEFGLTQSLNEEVAIFMDTVNKQWDIFKETIHITAIEIGQFLKPAVLGILGILNMMANTFKDINRATDGAFGAFVLLTGAIFAISIALTSFATIFGITGNTIRAGIAGAFRPLAKAFRFLIPAFVLKDLGKFKSLIGGTADVMKTRLLPPLRNVAGILKGLGIAALATASGRLKKTLGLLVSFIKGKLMGPFMRLRGILVGVGSLLIGLIPAPLIKAFGKLRTLVSKVLTRFTFLRKLFIGLPGLLKLVAVALGIALIARLIDVQKAWRDFKAFVDLIIGSIATFLKTQGPKLIGGAFFIIGDTIRGVLLELGRAIIGSDESIIRTIIGDIVSYLMTDASADLKEAGEILFNLIGAAALGLARGLIGDEDATFKQIFRDIADWLINTAKGILRNAADAALQGIINSFNAMKRKLIGGSIVPETFSDISAHVKGEFAPEFTGNVGDAVSGAETAFAGMSPSPGMGRANVGRTSITKINVGPIHANSREEGRAAVRGLEDELRSNGLLNKVD